MNWVMCKTKLAAIEAEWHFNLPLPHLPCLVFLTKRNAYRLYIKIPYVMGIIATRSINKVTGLHDLMKEHEIRIRNGMVAYSELKTPCW